MNTKERLEKFIAHKGLATSRFEAMCGLSNAYVRNLKSQIGDDKLKMILNTFPELSKVWLLTGEGTMLVSDSVSLPSLPTAPEKSDEIAFDVETKDVPLLPMEAVGGRLDGFAADGVYLSQCERIKTPLKNAEYAIRVTGQSMQPLYPSGCVLFIAKNNGSWLEWGRVYVLDTDNGVVVKQLTPSDEGKDFVRCVSLNAAPEYAPFDIPLSSVFGVYRVLGAFTEL